MIKLIQRKHLYNICLIQSVFDVDELTSFYMAEALTGSGIKLSYI